MTIPGAWPAPLGSAEGLERVEGLNQALVAVMCSLLVVALGGGPLLLVEWLQEASRFQVLAGFHSEN